MNWHQIAFQLVTSALFATIVGIVLTFAFNATIKRLEDSNARQLESIRHGFNKERDSRQAQIDRSNYATQRALEIELKAIQDMYAGIARLRLAMESSRHPNPRIRPTTPQEQIEILPGHTRELDKASGDMLRLIMTTRLFYPGELFEAAVACLKPVTDEVVDIQTHKDYGSPEWLDRARQNREAFYPLEERAGNLLRERLEEFKRPPE
jgi:hypothetical protein